MCMFRHDLQHSMLDMHISLSGEQTLTSKLPLKLHADQVMMLKQLFSNMTLSSLVERKIIAAALNVDNNEVNRIYHIYYVQKKRFERKHSGEYECLQIKLYTYIANLISLETCTSM